MAKVSTRPRKSSVYNISGAFELFSKSYRLVRENFQLFMILYSIPALLALWDMLGRYVGDKNSSSSGGGFISVFAFGPSNNSTFYDNAGGLIAVLIVPYLLTTLMLMVLWLRTAQGHHPTFKNLWQDLVSNWLWLKLIGSIIAVGVLTVVGFVLIIIPGIILLWRLFLVPYILIDKKTTISEAIVASWEMTKGYPWEIYSVLLVMLLLALTSLLPVVGPVVSFLLTAAYSVAPALRYQEIKQAQAER